jgi:hypothetical protein
MFNDRSGWSVFYTAAGIELFHLSEQLDVSIFEEAP